MVDQRWPIKVGARWAWQSIKPTPKCPCHTRVLCEKRVLDLVVETWMQQGILGFVKRNYWQQLQLINSVQWGRKGGGGGGGGGGGDGGGGVWTWGSKEPLPSPRPLTPGPCPPCPPPQCSLLGVLSLWNAVSTSVANISSWCKWWLHSLNIVKQFF